METRLTYLDHFHTPEALAAELRICLKTLERWRLLGEGPKITKIGRRVYYRKSSVAAWLAAREEAHAAGGRRQRPQFATIE